MTLHTLITTAARRVALVAILLGAAAPLSAAPPDGPPGPPAGGMRMALRGGVGDSLGDGPGMLLPLMLRHADLTAEQHQRVRDIMEGDRERLKSLFQQLDAANDALASKVVAPGPVDVAQLKPELDHVAHLRQELMEQGLKTALAVRAVLTPEQLEKAARTQSRLRELQEEMRKLLEGS